MNTQTDAELMATVGGQSGLTTWGEQAAADGLNWSTKSGGNLLVMVNGTLLAAAGGWAWAIGSAWDGFTAL